MIVSKKMSLGILVLGMFACTNTDNTGADKRTVKEIETTDIQLIKTDAKSLSLEIAWQSDSILPTNESVFYFEQEDYLFVSNIDGKPTDFDNKGSIAKLSTDGKIIDANWATGINAPKGMCVLGEKLFVSDINQVIAIALDNPKDRDYYPVQGAQFLNDLSTDGKAVFVSDMSIGTLHSIKDGTVSLLMDSLPSLNGLCYSEGQLYGLNGEGLLQFNLEEGTYQVLNDKVQGGDGLISLSDGKFIASKWQGEVWYINGQEATQLLNTKEEGIQTADIDYNSNTKTLYVPRFFSNYVSAYSVITD
jgi:hypothetical protein